MNIPIKSILWVCAGSYLLGAACTPPVLPTTNTSTQAETKEIQWVTQSVAAVPGQYADADVVRLEDGMYRMYFATEPEVVSGQDKPIYSALSADGVHWAIEDGSRLTHAAFPDALQLPDGNWRMYFQSDVGVGIKSAVSTDGLNWTEEDGVRVDTTEESVPTVEIVGAPSTTQLTNGSFVMVYRGTVNQPYAADVPNSNTQLFFWATSPDGITWKKQGLALDTRTQPFEGLADGPDWVRWSDGTLRLYFWGYQGVYYSTFSNDVFSQPTLTLETPNPQHLMYPPNPPGDPSLVKIKETWYMYYGIHEQGIYYATLSPKE